MSQRILLVRLGSLGDIVHALPVGATLRAAFPEARIDWLVEHQWQELVELHPGLTNVIPVDTLGWRRAPFSGAAWRELRNAIKALRRGGYDSVLDLQGLYKSSLLAFASGAARRAGFDVYSLKEPGASMFYTVQVVPGNVGHVVEKNLALAAAVGAEQPVLRFDLPATPEDEERVEKILKEKQLKNFFVISPGGGWGSKLWPLERYADLARTIVRGRGWQCYLNTGPEEDHLWEGFRARAPEVSSVNFSLTLRQLIVLLRRAKLLVCGDTGPLHLAAALGTPAVALFGPTDPGRNGPYALQPERAAVVHHKELGIRTYKHEKEFSPAMLAITVEEAMAAVDRVLGGAGG